MGKKIFLTSDGFSFHTLELRWNPTDAVFANAFDRLRQCSRGGEFYPVKENGGVFAWRCNAFSRNGIQVFLARGRQNMISLTVNPRKLLEPDASYLGIVPPYQDTLEEIRDNFTLVMRKAGLPEDMNAWQLHRLDLCVNICWNRKNAAAELIRLLRLGEPLSSAFVKESEQRRHAVRWDSGRAQLVAYDKLLQMKREGLMKGEKLPKSVLRVELHCGRAWIRDFSKKEHLETTVDAIQALSQNSRKLILKYAQKCMYGGMYRKLKAQLEIVDKSDGMKKKMRKRLKSILRTANSSSLKEARKGLTEEQWETCLAHFQRLGIHPLPLREKYPVKQLPSLLMILNELGEGRDSVSIKKNGHLVPCIF